MNTLEIPEKDISMEIPSHWDEMTPGQCHYCLKQAVWASRGVISPLEAKVRCLYDLLEIERDWKAEAMDRVWDQHSVHDKYSRIYLLCEELITFLFSVTKDGQLEINYDTVMNHFPEITVGKTTLYGPDHLCANLSLAEIRTAIEYMNEYFETKEEISLYRFIACLYRPMRANYETLCKQEDFDGQIREPFNRARIDEHQRWIKGMGNVYHTAILLWFSYVIHYVQREDLTIGGGTVNFSILFSKKEIKDSEFKPEKTVTPWIYLLHGLAKEGPFGDIEKADKTNWLDVLLYLEDSKRQQDKLKIKKR